ncbi:hypothetical protein BURKHO8Y_120196 [Burkholderia sp. 8Y]|nr:hypothetical protein BURKHO8Y_120196 [Burkholderia sp. 8Y]
MDRGSACGLRREGFTQVAAQCGGSGCEGGVTMWKKVRLVVRSSPTNARLSYSLSSTR